MSVDNNRIKLFLDIEKINRRDARNQSNLFSYRASTSSVSTRINILSVKNSPRKLLNDRQIFPYPGLNIGYMKLEKRANLNKKHSLPTTNYTHYFSDIYLNSETISFQKEEHKIKESLPSNTKDYLKPVKIDFRRLKRKSWTDIKARETEIFNVVTNVGSRSVGKAYKHMSTKKKELLPLTKFNSKKQISESLDLRIKGILKTFK
ncbi:hypothetical protein SteCoe_2263 [Stentor coeruleus]|uniref:Uncharacterized protein n=1 Tax=Stentor coeruleus TaxID=5963 RepID=A0A1R2CZS3_9CILI|nr:hypothetical protein SteCoe_2263 [Stentor coeruleus]